MTVSRLGRNDGVESAWCVWFEKAASHSGAFPLHALRSLAPEPADDPEAPPPQGGCDGRYCREHPLRIERVFVSPGDVAPAGDERHDRY